MSTKIILLIATALVIAGSVDAAELRKIGEIAVPGEPLTHFDISYVDQQSQRYFLSDRSNRSIDVFDAKTEKFIGRVGGFVGLVKLSGKLKQHIWDSTGPSGLLAVGNEVWAGDGNSTVKVVDLATMKISETIKTNGASRVDEMAYDPKNKIFIGFNSADSPPFGTLISMKPGHKIVAKVSIPEGSDGTGQPSYNPADGMFYVAIPELNKDEKKGGVAVIESTTGRVVKILEVDNCSPNGLVFGPDQNFLLGCEANGKLVGPPILVVMNAKTGKVVANIKDIGGADMVAYSEKNGQYYSASRSMQSGPVLGVIDAKTNKLLQKISIVGGHPQSVSVNETSGHVYLPVGKQDGGCGCIQVYSAQ